MTFANVSLCLLPVNRPSPADTAFLISCCTETKPAATALRSKEKKKEEGCSTESSRCLICVVCDTQFCGIACTEMTFQSIASVLHGRVFPSSYTEISSPLIKFTNNQSDIHMLSPPQLLLFKKGNTLSTVELNYFFRLLKPIYKSTDCS